MPTIQWNAHLYDESHAFVSRYGGELLNWLQPQAGEHILDLGCGTGTLANDIANSGALVTGIDHSADMIARARQAYPHIRFLVQDAAAFALDETFDAIFSNATLHWVNHAGEAVDCMYHHLKPGGRLVLEFGGKGNVQHITAAVEKAMQQQGLASRQTGESWYFPSISDYTALLEQRGLEVNTALLFERPTELAGEDGMETWLNMFGEFFFRHLTPAERAAVTRQALALLKPQLYREDTWYADYKRIRIRAFKPSER